MPAVEIVDQSTLGSFFELYGSFDSVILPDFTGACVRAYIEIRDVAVHIKHLCLAFPDAADNENRYWLQCPASFDTPKLQQLGDK